FLELLADDVVAELDALVADEHRGARDQLADFVLALSAKRAVKDLAAVVARSALPVVSHRSRPRRCRSGCHVESSSRENSIRGPDLRSSPQRVGNVRPIKGIGGALFRPRR